MTITSLPELQIYYVGRVILWAIAAKKPAETMEMGEAWPDTFNKGYIHHFQTWSLRGSRGTNFKDIVQSTMS